MHQLQDEDIIQVVLQGDERAYAILVERYSHLVYTLSRRILANEHDAEEAAQDSFVKAYRSLGSYNKTSKFSTWLYTITRNTCISKTRGRNPDTIHKEEHILAGIGGTKDSVTEQLEKSGRKKMVVHAVSLLPVVEAEIITLFYIHEQTLEEICAILGINNSNAKVKLFRARKKLKEIMDTHYKDEVAEYRNHK